MYFDHLVFMVTPYPPFPLHCAILGGKGGYFEKLSYGSETWDMTSDGLGEMFKGDFAHTCADKFPAQVDGGLSRGSIMSQIFLKFHQMIPQGVL